MKTNYSYWEKFDVDKALDDADLKAEMEDRGKDYASLLEQQSKDAKRVQIEAQQAVDALRSKMAVDALKMKGGPRRSRRTGQSGEGPSGQPLVADINSSDSKELVAPAAASTATASASSASSSSSSSTSPRDAQVAFLLDEINTTLNATMADLDTARHIVNSETVTRMRRQEANSLLSTALRAADSLVQLRLRLQQQLVEPAAAAPGVAAGSGVVADTESLEAQGSGGFLAEAPAGPSQGGSMALTLLTGLLSTLGNLRFQLLLVLAQNSFALGHYAGAVEAHRVLILSCQLASNAKRPSSGAAPETAGSASTPPSDTTATRVSVSSQVMASLWCGRGLAFLAIGNLYLALLHMRQAADHYQAYFGLPEAIAQLEAVEDLITLDVKKYSEVQSRLQLLDSLRCMGFEVTAASTRPDSDIDVTLLAVSSPNASESMSHKLRLQSGSRLDGAEGLAAGLKMDMVTPYLEALLRVDDAVRLDASAPTPATSAPAPATSAPAPATSASGASNPNNVADDSLYMGGDCSGSESGAAVSAPVTLGTFLGDMTAERLGSKLQETGTSTQDLVSSLFLQSRQLFYQGQVLSQENMHHAALRSFSLAALLAAVALSLLYGGNSCSSSPDVGIECLSSQLAYAVATLTTSLSNAALSHASLTGNKHRVDEDSRHEWEVPVVEDVPSSIGSLCLASLLTAAPEALSALAVLVHDWYARVRVQLSSAGRLTAVGDGQEGQMAAMAIIDSSGQSVVVQREKISLLLRHCHVLEQCSRFKLSLSRLKQAAGLLVSLNRQLNADLLSSRVDGEVIGHGGTSDCRLFACSEASSALLQSHLFLPCLSVSSLGGSKLSDRANRPPATTATAATTASTTTTTHLTTDFAFVSATAVSIAKLKQKLVFKLEHYGSF